MIIRTGSGQVSRTCFRKSTPVSCCIRWSHRMACTISLSSTLARLGGVRAQITSNSSLSTRFSDSSDRISSSTTRTVACPLITAIPSRTPQPSSQQIRGNCSPDSQSTMRPPPNAGRHLHEVMIVGDHLADDRGVAAERMRAHRRQQRRPPPPARRSRPACLRWRRRADRARAIRRPPPLPAGPARASSSMPEADAGLLRQFVQRRRQPAAGRIAHHPQALRRGRDHRGDQPVQRGGVGDDRGLEGEVLPLRHHRDAVIADRSRTAAPCRPAAPAPPTDRDRAARRRRRWW